MQLRRLRAPHCFLAQTWRPSRAARAASPARQFHVSTSRSAFLTGSGGSPPPPKPRQTNKAGWGETSARSPPGPRDTRPYLFNKQHVREPATGPPKLRDTRPVVTEKESLSDEFEELFPAAAGNEPLGSWTPQYVQSDEQTDMILEETRATEEDSNASEPTWDPAVAERESMSDEPHSPPTPQHVQSDGQKDMISQQTHDDEADGTLNTSSPPKVLGRTSLFDKLFPALAESIPRTMQPRGQTDTTSQQMQDRDQKENDSTHTSTSELRPPPPKLSIEHRFDDTDRDQSFAKTTPRNVQSFDAQMGTAPEQAHSMGQEEGNRISEATPKPPLPSRKSLFDELFPRVTREIKPRKPPQQRATQTSVDEPSSIPEDFSEYSPSTTPTTETAPTFSYECPPSSRVPFSVPETTRSAPTAAPTPDDSAVLIITSTTPTLQPSDFLRLAPQGAHLTGWAGGGLHRVLQARDPRTYTPKGTYFLFFDSRAAAASYAAELQRLHELSEYIAERGGAGIGAGISLERGAKSSRRARWRQMKDLQQISGGYAGLNPIIPGENDADAAALRAYALVPPGGKLNIELRHGSGGLSEEFAARSGVASVFSRGRDDDDVAQTSRVLLTLSGGSRPPGPVSSSPTGLTVDELHDLLARDGAARNLPWAILPNRNGVVPVKWLVNSMRGKRGVEDVVRRLGAELSGPLELSVAEWRTSRRFRVKGERHGRFIVSFGEGGEARRFVRAWHRREIEGAVVGVEVLW